MEQKTVDLLVIGGGAAGMTAALTGRMEGLDVLLCEKAKQVGGTTATSGGTTWVPGTHLSVQAGVPDKVEDARTFLKSVVGERGGEHLREAFLRSGPDMVAELDAKTAVKFAAALASGLSPILCVGETLAQREAGKTVEVVAAQIDAVLKRVGVAAFSGAVVAYEPVWAIGTGRTATSAQAQEVHAAIRAQIAAADAQVAEGLQILYGGSVKPGNAEELFAMADIDGGLIGGASLVAADFLAICRAAVK